MLTAFSVFFNQHLQLISNHKKEVAAGSPTCGYFFSNIRELTVYRQCESIVPRWKQPWCCRSCCCSPVEQEELSQNAARRHCILQRKIYMGMLWRTWMDGHCSKPPFGRGVPILHTSKSWYGEKWFEDKISVDCYPISTGVKQWEETRGLSSFQQWGDCVGM